MMITLCHPTLISSGIIISICAGIRTIKWTTPKMSGIPVRKRHHCHIVVLLGSQGTFSSMCVIWSSELLVSLHSSCRQFTYNSKVALHSFSSRIKKNHLQLLLDWNKNLAYFLNYSEVILFFKKKTIRCSLHLELAEHHFVEQLFSGLILSMLDLHKWLQ